MYMLQRFSLAFLCIRLGRATAESGRATAPPGTDPATPSHYSPCRFTDIPNPPTFSASKSEVDSELQQLLSFLQKRNEGESMSKRRRRDQAMSHYPDDKRMAGYQWEWGGRGPFCSAPQGWGPMGMPPMSHAPPGPYYPTHMVPAHSHAHLNQWTPPVKIQHAHSQPKPMDTNLPLPPTPIIARENQSGTVDLSAHGDPVRMRGPAEPVEKPVQLTKPRSDVNVIDSNEERLATRAEIVPQDLPAPPAPATPVPPVPMEETFDKDKEISSTGVESGEDGIVEPESLQAETPPQPPIPDPLPVITPPEQVDAITADEEQAPAPQTCSQPEEPCEQPTVTCSEVASEPIVSGSEPANSAAAEDDVRPCNSMETGSEATSQPTVSSTSTDVKVAPKEVRKKKKVTKKATKNKRVAAAEQKKGKLQKPPQKTVERRGPVLQIVGPKDAPVSVAILNGPRHEDDDEKRPVARNSRPLEHRGRTRQGLFSSTLSARYDAARPDPTWICVFCKLGPHARGLGDLFGPYVISREQQEELCEFSGDERDIVETQKRGGRTKKSIRMNHLLDHFRNISRKLKRRQPQESSESMSGLFAMSDDESDVPRYEVWTHEMCAVWSPGVCLVDTGLLGLQDAVWHCYQAMCSKCGQMGANIGCIHRNCPNRSHYACAIEAGWSLPLDTFISTCHFHVQRS